MISGLYSSLIFRCVCSNELKINTSRRCSTSARRDINVRSAIGESVLSTIARIDHSIVKVGANLAGIGHQGLAKLCASMSLQPPIDEDHFSRTITEILPSFEFERNSSMKQAVEEACVEAKQRRLTVSGESKYKSTEVFRFVPIVCSKVLDIERLSKTCSVCTGLLSIKDVEERRSMAVLKDHLCEMNHTESSGDIQADICDR